MIPNGTMVETCFWCGPLGHWWSISKCVLFFSLFWSRKQHVQHILCCDESFQCYWRQERIQIFKARITTEGLEQGWMTWVPFSVMCCVRSSSRTWSLCLNVQLQKRSNSTPLLLLSFFFSILLKTLFISSWGSPVWDSYQPDLNTARSRRCVGFLLPRILSYLLSSSK